MNDGFRRPENLPDSLIWPGCGSRSRRHSLQSLERSIEGIEMAALKLSPCPPIYGSVMQPMAAGALQSEPFPFIVVVKAKLTFG
ncbi:hypothetical protein HGP16_28955 [Rhizobium sp. P40RR-XXII]|uniref:hypothetical protein n=1 Tax=unclassified Rhizobium TaxID=2613769 RepID=UPI001456E09F|nr:MULTISPECIES: hypothetical protein [unclassified Rhizobium]NLR89497.1 hypothetical protein [Rhizobium sp. P28RR-XV]NLS20551.1 hypothetical protein [Rhizobium sp. P40RR-XXII]